LHLPVLGFQETTRAIGACVRAQLGNAHSKPCPIVLMGYPGSGRTAAVESAGDTFEIVRARPLLAGGGVSALAGRVAKMDADKPSIVLIEGAADLHARHKEAVRSLLEDHCAGGEPLSAGTVVVAEADIDGKMDFLSSDASAIRLHFDNGPQEWCGWACSAEIDPIVVALIATSGHLLSGRHHNPNREGIQPSPAKWQRLSDSLSVPFSSGTDIRTCVQIAESLVGCEATDQLFEARRIAAKIPGVAKMPAAAGGLTRTDDKSAIFMAARVATHAQDDVAIEESGRALLAMSQIGGVWTEGFVLALRWMAKSKPTAFLDSMFQAVPELQAEIRKFGLD